MNAFDNREKNVVRPADMKTPLIAIAGLSNEGPKNGSKTRIMKVSQVLAAHDLTFDDYSKQVH